MYTALDMSIVNHAPSLTQDNNVVSAASLSEIVGIGGPRVVGSAPTISEKLAAETDEVRAH
jgi:hypothetical protein